MSEMSDPQPSSDPGERAERLQRLRRLGVRRGRGALRTPATTERSLAQTAGEGRAAAASLLESLVGGQEVVTPFGSCVVATRRYELEESRGGWSLGAALRLSSLAAAACGNDPGLEAFDFATAAFIDTETSGLAGGAGTFAFMVGIGHFDPTGQGYIVRQVFMRSPAEERALLHAVSGVLAGCSSLVSFNGRAFDAPLLTTRYLLHREPSPLADLPHLDLLSPARRVWRRRVGSCALGSLEATILDFRRGEEDVPGWLIPSLYADYARGVAGGQPSAAVVTDMARVFYHNREDIVSMVPLAVALCAPFEREASAQLLPALHPIDRLSLGQCYERLGWLDAGECAYRLALADALPDEERAQTLHRLGWLLKRQERHDEAVAVWQDWITSVPGADPTPFVELAKYHEWHGGDLEEARKWSLWGLHTAKMMAEGVQRDLALAELEHRLQRLARKLA